jgi:hypothetical protein
LNWGLRNRVLAASSIPRVTIMFAASRLRDELSY